MNTSNHAAPPARPVLEAASWSLATDLARRHPELFIFRYHPMGGQSDCLAIRSERGIEIDLNRTGSIHLLSMQGGGTPRWADGGWPMYPWSAYLADPQGFLLSVEELVGLPPVHSRPPTTPRVLSYRVLSAFARLHALGPAIDIETTMIDTSGYGGGPSPWLASYPRIAHIVGDEPFGAWRATSKDSEFVIEVETARLHQRDGSPVALSKKYSAVGRNFERLMGFVLDAG